jgi:hypothetical protein
VDFSISYSGVKGVIVVDGFLDQICICGFCLEPSFSSLSSVNTIMTASVFRFLSHTNIVRDSLMAWV